VFSWLFHFTISTFPDLENDEDLKNLERDIADLQEANLTIEAQNIKLRSEITGLETRLYQNEKDTKLIEEKSHTLEEYLNSLRSTLVRCFQGINLPMNGDTSLSHVTSDNLDTYIQHIQTICTENGTAGRSQIYQAIRKALMENNLIWPRHSGMTNQKWRCAMDVITNEVLLNVLNLSLVEWGESKLSSGGAVLQARNVILRVTGRI
jgi:hypothetical protein